MKGACILFVMMRNQANGVLDRFMLVIPDITEVEATKTLIEAKQRRKARQVDSAGIYQVVDSLGQRTFFPTKQAQM